jgi:hypothetical protein
MRSPCLADQINQLPFERWLDKDESAKLIGLPPEEVNRVLRAGRRSGSITVCRTEEGSTLIKRVRRHPHSPVRRPPGTN